jgi:hypothetical protein
MFVIWVRSRQSPAIWSRDGAPGDEHPDAKDTKNIVTTARAIRVVISRKVNTAGRS